MPLRRPQNGDAACTQTNLRRWLGQFHPGAISQHNVAQDQITASDRNRTEDQIGQRARPSWRGFHLVRVDGHRTVGVVNAEIGGLAKPAQVPPNMFEADS